EKFSYLRERATSIGRSSKETERYENPSSDFQPVSLERIIEANREALSKYVVKKYFGRITLFRALLGNFDDPRLFWRPVAAGDLQIHDIPSGHFFLGRAASRRILAEKLCDCLDQSQKEYETGRRIL